MIHWAHFTHGPKRQLDRFSHFLFGHCHIIPIHNIASNHLPPHSQIAPFCRGRSRPPSNTSFLGLTQPTIQNGLWIESVIFLEFTVVTDGQTDRLTKWTWDSVCTSRPLTLYVCHGLVVVTLLLHPLVYIMMYAHRPFLVCTAYYQGRHHSLRRWIPFGCSIDLIKCRAYTGLCHC